MPRVVVVLGMDRSGTSLCTHILNSLGIQLGENLIPPDGNNVGGYYEEREIFLTHERILSLLGRSWDTIAALQPFPPLWWRSSEIESVIGELVDLVNSRTDKFGDQWGFKDPRTVSLFPLWREVFRRCNVQPIFIVCVRNPAAVAASLSKRDGFEPRFSELLWLEKTLLACLIARRQPHCVMYYERWFTDPSRQLQVLAETVGARVETTPGNHLATILRDDLRHDKGRALRIQSRVVSEFYESLRDKENLIGVRLGRTQKMFRVARESARVGEALRNRTDINEASTARSAALDRLPGDIVTRDAIIAELNGQIADQRTRVKVLREEVISRDQLVNTLKFQVASRGELVNTLRDAVTSSSQLVSTLRDAVTSRGELVNALRGEVTSRGELVNTLRDEVTSRGQLIERLTIELKGKIDREKELARTIEDLENQLAGKECTIEKLAADLAARKGLLMEVRLGSKAFDTSTEGWIQERRADKSWQLMLAVRKAGSLLLRQGWLGRARFIRWALWELPRGTAGLEGYEPSPPHLREFLPPVGD